MSAAAGEPACPPIVGVMKLDDGRWALFLGCDNNSDHDQFWDGTGWTKDAGKAMPFTGMTHSVRRLFQGDWYRPMDGGCWA